MSRPLGYWEADQLAAMVTRDFRPPDLMPPPERSPIFLVDHKGSVRKTLGKYLHSKGYPVLDFGAPEEALEALRAQRISLLITDIAMPGMSGVELAERALQIDPDLAIVIITGVPESDTAIDALRLGVSDYLAKPFKLDELARVVQQTLHRRVQQMYRRSMEAWLRVELELQTEELQSVMVSTLASLVRAMEAKAPFLKGHSERVAALAEKIADLLAPEHSTEIRSVGLLHDIGKIQLKDRVLEKPGGHHVVVRLDRRQRPLLLPPLPAT